MNYDETKTARRRLENQLRQDCARLERLGVNPEDLEIALRSTMAFWWGELQDIEIP